jgi:SAM-dependent methyltransferase
MSTSENQISNAFEQSFLRTALEQQIANCDHYELTPLFLRVLGDHQPILEAGSGSGRWVAWFVKQGWSATGIDWSEALCERARHAVPGGVFVAGDMRKMPFGEASFGSIVSLGAIEHDAEGPSVALKEYLRVLRPGGIAIVTVPHLGPVRKLNRWVKGVLRPLYSVIRQRFHLQDALLDCRRRRVAQAGTRPEWAADLMRDSESGWSFFQYNFTLVQLRGFLENAGFEIAENFVDFRDEGILHNFGRLAGTYDFQSSRVRLSPIGRVLKVLLPVNAVGHMVCCVARKPL